MFRMIANPLGMIMKLCYDLIKDYGIALFVFTFLIKVLMLPLQIKQQKSVAKTSRLTPQIEKLKKKYGNDKQKLQQEMAKFYAEQNVSPMGSCLPMLVTMLVLFSLIYVVYQPMTYVMRLDEEIVSDTSSLITNMCTISTELDENDKKFADLFGEELTTNFSVVKFSDASDDILDAYKENEMAYYINSYSVLSADDKVKLSENILDKFNDYSKIEKISDKKLKDCVAAMLKHPDIDEYFNDTDKVSKSLKSRPELLVFDMVQNQDYGDIFDSKVEKEVSEFNYKFFNLFLGKYPKFNSILVLIPILSFLSQLICTIVSQYYSKKNNPSMSMGSGMTMMLYIMPLFSLFIGFSFPAGLGLYWIYSSLFALIQTVLLNKIYTPEHMEKIISKELEDGKEKRKKKASMMERMLEMQNGGNNSNTKSNKKVVDGDEDDIVEDEVSDSEVEEKVVKKKNSKPSKSELKDAQRKKLNDARRKMAEKYGDDYYDE